MKSSIIDIVFKGIGQKLTDSTKRIKYSSQEIIEIEETLKSKLSTDLFNLVKEYDNAVFEYYDEDLNVHFKEGFIAGLKIGMECSI